jgi:hypothetical protein
MSTQVTIALLAAGTSLVVAVVTATWTGANAKRLFNLEQSAKREERALTAKEELDQYREPLLRAALDLASRIDNIRNKNYLEKYLSDDGGRRSQIARISTCYRFARFWCVVENLYSSVGLVHFEQDEQTREVASMLRRVGKVFATDDYGPSFMMWRDEQRAVAELTRGPSGGSDTIGFAKFFNRYASTFDEWFRAFEADLVPRTARKSPRFQALQRDLAALAEQLDTAGTYRKQTRKLLEAV